MSTTEGSTFARIDDTDAVVTPLVADVPDDEDVDDGTAVDVIDDEPPELSRPWTTTPAPAAEKTIASAEIVAAEFTRIAFMEVSHRGFPMGLNVWSGAVRALCQPWSNAKKFSVSVGPAELHS
jgi:hypothetical protein